MKVWARTTDLLFVLVLPHFGSRNVVRIRIWYTNYSSQVDLWWADDGTRDSLMVTARDLWKELQRRQHSQNNCYCFERTNISHRSFPPCELMMDEAHLLTRIVWPYYFRVDSYWPAVNDLLTVKARVKLKRCDVTGGWRLWTFVKHTFEVIDVGRGTTSIALVTTTKITRGSSHKNLCKISACLE